MQQKPTAGRVVHYYLGDVHLADGRRIPQWRPACVVLLSKELAPETYDDTVLQLQVLLDGTNDRNVAGARPDVAVVTAEETQLGMAWRTSVPMAGEVPKIGEWRWPPREAAAAQAEAAS